MTASLLIDGPGMWAFHVDLDKNKEEIVFGRSRNNDLVLSDSRVSSRHGSFSHNPEGWLLQDLQSSNGSFINGSQITSSPLRNGDVVRVGDTEMVFQDKETAVDDDVWGRTVMRFSQHETAIRGALKKAASDEVVVVPDLHLVPASSNQAVETAATAEPAADPATPGLEFDPGQFEPRKVDGNADSREEMLWLAEKMADILGALATHSQQTKKEFYTDVLSQISDIIQAENGFLMLPDRETKRWVIEAYVGDPAEWTEYEKQRPVPLTVANRAFKEDKVVTNAFGKERLRISPSMSMVKLNVQFYIAVPLHRNGKKEGLMYFDTRKGLTLSDVEPGSTPKIGFTPRDVKLLERIGSYVLEINRAVG